MTVENAMETTVKRNMLKYQVGRQMFCPYCQVCMDCKKAVSLDISQGDKLVAAKVICATCWDGSKDRLIMAITEKGFTLDITDGRELFKRKK